MVATPLPPLLDFRDVLAGASPNRDTPGVDWHAVENYPEARLWRRGAPVCNPPSLPDIRPERIDAPGLFVSMHDTHFGHLVAETIPRLPQALAEAPDLPLWFSSRRPLTVAQSSGAFRAVTRWLGLAPERLRFVHRPTEFRSLTIAAQGEHLDGPPPPPEYLDLLEARLPSRFRPARPHQVTFVTREGLSPALGRQAGERYLADRLRALGVQVIRPEALPLEEQMRIYAESRQLIFSEGSAVHGRQLLGRIDQDIAILRRRYRSHMARDQIAPRCRSLTYVPCFGGALFVTDKQGLKVFHAMSAQYDLPPLFAFFESLGLPLASLWNDADFARERDADILAWAAHIFGEPGPSWGRPVVTAAQMLDQLEPLRLGHLREALAEILRAAGLTLPTPPRPVAAAAVDYLAIRGEQGLDLYAVRPHAGASAGYHCVARWRTLGRRPELHLHDALPEAEIRALARLAPRAVPVADDHALALAREAAKASARRLLRAAARDAEGLIAQPDPLRARVGALYAHNLVTPGVQLAGRLAPALEQRLDSGRIAPGQSDALGHAMRMLGDLAGRAGAARLALACHDAAIRAGGDNPHRRAKREAAAARLRA